MSTDFSQDPQDNPYSSPEAESMAADQPVDRLTPRRTAVDYMQAYTYIFENPNWVMNVLILALLVIVPILGAIVMYGYVFEVIAVLAYGRARYPDFSFDRLGPYLLRGLWVILTMFIFQMVVVLAYGLLVAAAGVAGAALGEGAGAAMFLLALLIYMVLLIAMAFIWVPAVIRVGLSNELSEAFKFDWIKDFVSKMWVEQLLAGLFLMVSAMLLSMVGFFALCVGVLFASALVSMAFAHLNFQLYQVYLSRGGQPVAISTK